MSTTRPLPHPARARSFAPASAVYTVSKVAALLRTGKRAVYYAVTRGQLRP